MTEILDTSTSVRPTVPLGIECSTRSISSQDHSTSGRTTFLFDGIGTSSVQGYSFEAHCGQFSILWTGRSWVETIALALDRRYLQK